jgi:hypothetical protein
MSYQNAEQLRVTRWFLSAGWQDRGWGVRVTVCLRAGRRAREKGDRREEECGLERALAGFVLLSGGGFQLLQFLLPGFTSFLALQIEFPGGLALFQPFVNEVTDEDRCYDAHDDEGSEGIAGKLGAGVSDFWTYR